MHNSGCRKKFSALSIIALTTSALVVLPVVANASPLSVPDTARPENIQRQLRLQEQRPAVSNKPVITVGEQGGKELKGNLSFELKSVQFEGGNQLQMDEISSFYKDKIGKKITLGELNKIAADITAYYRNKGFILTRAVVPPQRINKGAVKIRIIEGYVDSVVLKGDVGNQNSVLYKYAEKIKESKPLDAATLERYLLLMEDLPGVEARAVLQPSPTNPGASQVVVNIKRNSTEGSTVLLDNRGTRFLGPVQATVVLTGNNVLNQDEQTSLRVTNTPLFYNELRYYGVHHEDVVGAQGTKLLFDGSFVETQPGDSLEAFDVDGKNYLVSAGVSHPIIRSRQSNWFVNSDFSVQRINLDSLSTNLYQDKLRVWKVGSAYDFVDQTNAVNRVEGNVSKGFSWDTGNDGLGHSRSNGNSNFWKGTANLTRIQPIYGAVSASASVDGQVASRALYAAEEYALGGERFASAFDPAEVSGDSAVAARLELQYNGTSENKYVPTYQPYAFYDVGRIWNRNVIAASERKNASLASAGVGTRFNMADSMTGGMEVAFPVVGKVAASGEDGYAPRFFFNLQYRY